MGLNQAIDSAIEMLEAVKNMNPENVVISRGIADFSISVKFTDWSAEFNEQLSCKELSAELREEARRT